MARLVYFLLLFNLGCFLFDGFVAGCMEFIAEKHQREGSFAKRSPIEVEECVELCVQTDICFAVNYFRLNATCQFLNRTMPESKLVKAAKCLYKSVRGPPKESIEKDPCYQKLCPWDEICIHNTTTNLAQCYPLCKNPPVRSGAIYETAEVELGHNFTYRCQDGLFGKQNQNPTVTCLQDGNWTPTNFTCVCKTPPVKSGAINETAEVEIGENYTYKCQEGLFGKQNQNPTVTCLQDGNWTSTNFTCVCKTPIAKSGTINVTEEVELGQNYTYRCQDGLIGKRFQNPTVMCLPGGDWTTTNFTCVCKTPPVKSGAINETAEVEIGENYTYKCQEGLFGKQNQNPTVMCLPGGDWTTTNFTCVCKTPPVKPGAINETAEVELGENYTYQCQEGLFGKQNQNPTVTCLQDGNWTSTNFTCVCKTPIAKSGTINVTEEVELGQNYTYRCQDGLIGKRFQNPTVMCLPGGDWTTTNFTCVCKTPVKSGAINETAEVELGENCTYQCQEGLFGKQNQNPTVTCLQDGNWTSTNFTCVCKTPTAKSGTINETEEVELGQNYTYRCQNGLIGKRFQNPSVTCLPGGNFTTTNFSCVCKTPPVKSDAIIEIEEVELGQNYTYKCQDGLFGKQNQSPITTCLQDGNWTQTNFTCVCKTPIAKSGTINETAEVEIGMNYTYGCQDGLIGKRDQNPTITCLTGGNWTTTNFTCVCKAPAKSGAINQTTEVEIGQNYTYRCEINLFEKGDQNPTVTCLHDVKQNWTQDTIYPNNIHKSEVISNSTGIDLFACMQECDKEPTNCMSFFYDNHSSFCVLSSSFQRGLPEGFQLSDGLVYYTAPSTACDLQYTNVTLDGSYFCIKYHPEAKSFNEAMKACESEKAKLLVVTTKEQVTDLQILPLLDWVFIGLSDLTEEGRWVSWNGEIVHPFWGQGQPDDLHNADCACIWPRWWEGINDINCDSTATFLCHKNHL